MSTEAPKDYEDYSRADVGAPRHETAPPVARNPNAPAGGAVLEDMDHEARTGEKPAGMVNLVNGRSPNDIASRIGGEPIKTYQQLKALVQEAHPGAYVAGSVETGTRLIIVPARNAEEATAGSGVLAIGVTEFDAWLKAGIAVEKAREEPDDIVAETTFEPGGRMQFHHKQDGIGPMPMAIHTHQDLPTKFWPQPRFLNSWAAECHADNDRWWTDLETGKRLVRNDGELLLLMVSEIIEGFEGIRKDLMDDKLTHRKMIEVELADLLIRAFDFAGARGLDLDGAVAEKRAFNAVREDHTHAARLLPNGKKF